MLIKEFEKILIKHPVRGHIAPATIGHTCERYIWLNKDYNGCTQLSLKQKRSMERKNTEKTLILDFIKSDEIQSFSVESISNSVSGFHIMGFIDAILKDSEGLRYILLIKTSGDKRFKEIKRHGINKIKYIWWVQAQVSMVLSKINSTIILVLNKNDESLYEEIIDIIPNVGQDFLKRASLIDGQKEMPQGILNFEKPPLECYECIFHKKCYSQNL